MEIKVDKILGKIREKDSSTPTGGSAVRKIQIYVSAPTNTINFTDTSGIAQIFMVFVDNVAYTRDYSLTTGSQPYDFQYVFMGPGQTNVSVSFPSLMIDEGQTVVILYK